MKLQFKPFLCAAALAVPGALTPGQAAWAQERVYSTTPRPYSGIESFRVTRAPVERKDAGGEGLAGGPEPQAKTEQVWRATSSHIPADLEPRAQIPLAVVVDAPGRRPFRRRPGPRPEPRPDPRPGPYPGSAD